MTPPPPPPNKEVSVTQKAEDVAKKLLEVTRNNEIKWSRTTKTSFLTANNDTRVDAAFIGELKGKSFIIYEASFLTSYDGDSYQWTSSIELALLDNNGHPMWTFPSTKYHWDLYSAVVLKGCDVEQALDEILGEDWI